MKNGYYNKLTDQLIGNELETIEALRTTRSHLQKLRWQRPQGGWHINLEELSQPIKINSIIDIDGDEIASSIGELCRLEGLNTAVVLKRLRRVEGKSDTRRFIEEVVMTNKKRFNWAYKIYDANGKYLCDDMEKLADMTGIPLDQVYYHIRQNDKTDDSIWTFYWREIE